MAAEAHYKAEGKKICGRAAEDALQLSSGEHVMNIMSPLKSV